MRSLSAGEGAVAQLGEHLLCKQGVVGSIPSSSTRLKRVDWTRPGVGSEIKAKRQAFSSGF